MITYTCNLEGIEPRQLTGFCVGWENPLSPKQLHQVLSNSTYIVLATDSEQHQIVGFVNAISDGLLAAYIPLLEVLPAYQNQGIGSRLMQEMLQQTAHLHMVDLMCDQPLQPYYQRLGMHPATGMLIRRFRPYRF